MAEVINLDKQVFKKDNFDKIFDKNFKYFLQPIPTSNFTISDFFELYENLFYEILKEGEQQSHRYILNKTADYLGVKINDETDIQALLNEITSLKKDLLDANKTLLDLNKK
jgi:hypothetical protein